MAINATERISESQAKQRSTYENAGWDFSTVWNIEEGVGYPTLRQPPRYTETSAILTAKSTVSVKAEASLYKVIHASFQGKANVTANALPSSALISSSMTGTGNLSVQPKVNHYLKVDFRGKSDLQPNEETFVFGVIVIRDYDTLSEIDRTGNIIDPLISEQINDHYNFRFKTVYNETALNISYPNLIEADGDYFRIARVLKVRDSSVSVEVECDHVSYELNHIEDETEFYEEPAFQVVEKMLAKTRFTIGVVESNWNTTKYFAPSDKGIRKRLIDLASLIDGELEFNKFTIHLRNKRGRDNGVEFILGQNLKGVTEEIDTSEPEKRIAYEVDVLDLAQISGYEHLQTVGLGDTVRTYDPLLDIDVKLRVVKREYNPFQKVNPKISIGNVIRDITEYVRPEPPGEDGEDGDDGQYDDYRMEFGTALITGGSATLRFTQAYDEVLSITTGIISGGIDNVVIEARPIIENQKATGIQLTSTSNASVEVGVQAICHNLEEEGED